MENLWPDTFDLTNSNNPGEIIKAQLKELENITKGKVYGELIKSNRIYSDKPYPFVYDMIVASKYLDNYRFRVFTVRYQIPYYPLLIDLDEKISEELGLFERDIFNQIKDVFIGTEDEFYEILKNVFHSNHLGQIVSTLMNLVNSEIDF